MSGPSLSVPRNTPQRGGGNASPTPRGYFT
jgi:hypothetical protein